MKNLKTILTLIALAAGFGWTSVALAQASTAPQATEPAIDAGNLRAFVELARSDIKNDKALRGRTQQIERPEARPDCALRP